MNSAILVFLLTLPGQVAQEARPHELVFELPREAAATGRLEHARLSEDGKRLLLDADKGLFTSRSVTPETAFDQLLLSWNVDVQDSGAFLVEIQVGREETWSPWLHIGDWNLSAAPEGAVTRFDGGRVDVDVFRSAQHWDRARYRLRAMGGRGEHDLGVARFALCFSDTRRIPAPGTRNPSGASFEASALSVPLRRQGAEAPEIAARICSPTSVSMVLAFHGVDRPTAEVARTIYDEQHDIYGNWPRAVQAAFCYGVPGYLTRISDWKVAEELARETPLILSIKAAEGELRGAPYPKTNGHLIVLVGFDEKGRAIVNDPAAKTEESVRRVYLREDLERVWMGIGGVAYVIGR